MSTYVASSTAIATTATAPKQIAIPTGTAVGMFMLLEYVGSQVQASDLTNWNRIAQVTSGTCFVTWWWKIATSADIGTSVAVTTATSNAKTALTITVCSGTSTTAPIGAFATLAETTTSLTHAGPALTLPSGFNGKIIRSLALKDSSTAVSSTWTPPAGTVRASIGTAGISQVVGVQAISADTTTYAPGSWAVNASSANAVTLALALTDSVAPPPSSSVRGMMTGGNSGATATTTTSVLTLPGSAVAGDTAVIIASNTVASSAAPPTGWYTEASNIVSTNNKSYIFSRYLTASDITTGTVTITWSAAGRALSSGIVMIGLDANDPLGTAGYISGNTATLAAPSVTSTVANSQILQLTSCRVSDGAPSVPTYPSGWTRRSNVSTNFATTLANSSVSIATWDTPGAIGSYGGESIAFSGPGTAVNSTEQIYTIACQTIASSTTRLMYQRSGSTLRAVSLAKREGSSITLL